MQREELQNWVINNLITKNNKIRSTKISKKREFFKENIDYFIVLDFYTKYLGDVSTTEKIYCFINNVNQIMVCPICGNKVNFRSYRYGYYNYCSTKCSMNDSKTHDKIMYSKINNKTYKDKRQIFYNYIYLDPRKPGKYQYENLNFCLLYEPFYVGKGKDKRYLDHIKNKNITVKDKLINEINKEYNIQNYIIIFPNMEEENAYKNERIICRNIGIVANVSGPLLNNSYGGLGGLSRVVSEEEKMRRSKNHHMKNRTYEDIYGVEKAKQIKSKRSESLKNHECYKSKERSKKISNNNKNKVSVINLKTNEREFISLQQFFKNKFYILNKTKSIIKVVFNGNIHYFRHSKQILEMYSISGTLYRKIIKEGIYLNGLRPELKGMKITHITEIDEKFIVSNFSSFS